MNENPAFLVYQHIAPFFEGRGLRPASAAALKKTRDDFTAELTERSYFSVFAKGGAEEEVAFILLAPKGVYSASGPGLKDLVTKVVDGAPKKPTEVIVVAPGGVLEKKNMVDVIARLRLGDKDGEDGVCHYAMHPYAFFSVDIPKVQCVPSHRKMAPGEVAEVLARERRAVRDLPAMLAASPPVVWAGGRPGDVVRVDAPSETAGRAVRYYVVKDA